MDNKEGRVRWRKRPLRRPDSKKRGVGRLGVYANESTALVALLMVAQHKHEEGICVFCHARGSTYSIHAHDEGSEKASGWQSKAHRRRALIEHESLSRYMIKNTCSDDKMFY